MLQLSIIREQKEKIIQGLLKRNVKNAAGLIQEVICLDAERREAQKQLDEIKSKSNIDSKKIGELMKSGQTEQAAQLRSEISAGKEQIKKLEANLNELGAQQTDALYRIPNIPHDTVPDGSSSDDNKIVFSSEIPPARANALPHWELIKKYDIVDFELGIKITGAGFPVYKGKGAKLQRALINFFLDQALEQGYEEVQPPIVVNAASGYGTGQLPDKEGQMYLIPEDGLYLIPTAEVPITNLYRDVILGPGEIPVKKVGYTPCFRREAGNWGAHVRGLNRLHQFDKVEIVQITYGDNSYATLDEMCNHVQKLLQMLELPFRKLLLCGGDMGFNSAMTFDFEVYSAAQQRWLEVSSVSNFETYQSNRLKLRTKGKDGKIHLLHTLNGSALALPRIVAALLENNQTDQGIVIPEALRSYTGFDIIN